MSRFEITVFFVSLVVIAAGLLIGRIIKGRRGAELRQHLMGVVLLSAVCAVVITVAVRFFGDRSVEIPEGVGEHEIGSAAPQD
ncbi:MAG: hypothetical protein MI755_19425 [Sphingomonadales bacterium]|nr:hypothetical protein [Sphingomonadales bacterium]